MKVELLITDMSLQTLTCENQSYMHTCTHTLTEVNPCHGVRELGEEGIKGGKEKQETALSFTESGEVIRGVV